MNPADILKREFVRRKHANPGYSLRKFAQDIGSSAGRLSEYFSGKSVVSVTSAKKIAAHMKWNESEKRNFIDLAEAAGSKDGLGVSLARERIQNRKLVESYERLKEDQFKLISDWWHLAIVELSKLPDFDSTVPWISNRLNVPPFQVHDALDRLVRLGIATRRPGFPLKFNANRRMVDSEVPNAAIQSFHRQILDLCKEAVLNSGPDEREMSSSLISVDSNTLKEIKEIIRVRRRELAKKIEETNVKPDSLYCLGTYFFRLGMKK